ncbi:Transposon Tf2-6 poly, partial [Paramuricea clavata]
KLFIWECQSRKPAFHPTEEKVQAIKDAAPPANVSELQSFIGTPWKWSKTEQEAFTTIKSALCSDSILRHYDPAAELVLQCDASTIGVGAVLFQPGHDGSLQPVAYASRTLNAAEKNYAQIEHHKPLITLLGEHNSVPQLASARIKRWSLLLAAYNYTIEFISGKENVYADFLSRKPTNIQPTTPEEQVDVQVMFIEGEKIVNSTMVAMETKKDAVLSKVLEVTKNGWPEKLQPELQPYHTRRLELSHEDGILLLDIRVVIPIRDILLKDLHAEHFGIVKMKQLTRKYLWWSKLDKEIEEKSEEFQKFLNDDNIQHTTTAPGHPATNGLAERNVGNFKDKLKKMGDSGEPLQTKLDRFLLTYRATPTGLGKSPSELLMNRQPRIRLSALRAKQSKNEVKIFQDNLDNQPKYSQNQAVFARNFGKGARWLPGVTVKIISPRNYDVKVRDVMWKRHEEQLRPRHIPSFENAEQAKSEMEQHLFPETKTETNKRETIPAHTEDRLNYHFTNLYGSDFLDSEVLNLSAGSVVAQILLVFKPGQVPGANSLNNDFVRTLASGTKANEKVLNNTYVIATSEEKSSRISDYNECNNPVLGEHLIADCQAHSYCENTYGSWTCKCLIGFEKHSAEHDICVSEDDDWWIVYAVIFGAIGFVVLILIFLFCCLELKRNEELYTLHEENRPRDKRIDEEVAPGFPGTVPRTSSTGSQLLLGTDKGHGRESLAMYEVNPIYDSANG